MNRFLLHTAELKDINLEIKLLFDLRYIKEGNSKMGKTGYDFCGWATKNNLRCSDGRVIRRGAFKDNDGNKVPLVWNHQHNSASEILGHAILENRNEGVYAYCSFNNTSAGKDAKEAVKHGDVTSLSIWANDLEQQGSDVLHGVIREVSLVLAGANPGAFIESVLAHGEPMEDYDEEGIIYTGADIIIESSISHADSSDDEDNSKDGQKKSDDDNEDDKSSEKTIEEVFNTLNEEQKAAVAIIVGQAVSDSKQDNEEDEEMAHNIFDRDDNDTSQSGYLSHADGVAIIEKAKQIGSLKQAFREYMGDDVIIHAVPTGGMTLPGTSESTKTYGVKGMDMLLPEYQNQNVPPEFISRDQNWVGKVLSGVHKLPYEKVKTMFADITEDEARAKGYIKGDQKWPEVFSILTRTVDGQTIYKLQKLDRDDIITITEFELVPWIKREMDIMLDEEKARAILIGDGRLTTDKFKIKEDKIIPIVKDVDLFNIKVKVTVPANTSKSDVADTLIDKIIRARKKYKGSGEPSFYTTEDVITEMLSIKDKIGHRIYKTMQELATTLRVKEIVPVEPMSGYKIDTSELVGVIVNLTDYAVGQNPKAGRTMFEDFDIDFNKMTYLKEERFSGALRKPFSAITITLSGVSLSSDDEDSSGSEDTE